LVTSIELAPSTKSELAFIETALGEMLKIDPAVGDVETIEVAAAIFVPRNTNIDKLIT
jgi:hypothetical protein